MEMRERILLIWLAITRYEQTSIRVALGDEMIESAKFNYVNREKRSNDDVEVTNKFHWRMVDYWCKEQLTEIKSAANLKGQDNDT